MKDQLRYIQGTCKQCGDIIDKTRIITDKPTAMVYCKKCSGHSLTNPRAEQFLEDIKKSEENKSNSNPSKISISISVKDTEIFEMLLGYTKKLVDILEEYSLSDEHRAELDEISKDFFKFKREVDL